MDKLQKNTPDISMHAMFDWYQIAEDLTPVSEYPKHKQTLGWWWIGILKGKIVASVI
jgi:hypothetical protein